MRIHIPSPSTPDNCVNCGAEVLDPETTKPDVQCMQCGAPVCGQSQCVTCGEWKSDPDEFYDGLRCTLCCESDEEEDDEPDA